MRRATLALVFLLLVGGIALLLRLGDPAPAASGPPSAAAGIALFGYDAYGDPAWEAQAEHGDLVDGVGNLSPIRLSFPDDAGRLAVTADRLVYRADDRRLSGAVTVEREDGLRLQTEEIVWDEAGRQLSANAVTMVLSGLSIEAARFAYRIGSRQTVLSDGVAATITRDPPIRVNGDAAEEADGVVTIAGNVRIESEDGTFRCARLETDTAGERVVLSGEVDGTFRGGTIAARSVEWTSSGWTARGGVTVRIDLDSLEREPPDGA